MTAGEILLIVFIALVLLGNMWEEDIFVGRLKEYLRSRARRRFYEDHRRRWLAEREAEREADHK